MGLHHIPVRILGLPLASPVTTFRGRSWTPHFKHDSHAQSILETVVNANFLVLELITSVCLSSCLETELFEGKNSVLLLSIFMPRLVPATALGAQQIFVE